MAKWIGKMVYGVGIVGMVMTSQAQDQGWNQKKIRLSLFSPQIQETPVTEGAAYGWAIGGTILPITTGVYFASSFTSSSAPFDFGWALIGIGAIIGPSMGQYVAGSGGQATLGVLERIVGTGLIIGGAAYEIETASSCAENNGTPNPCPTNAGGLISIGVGAGAFVISAIYDLIDTHFAVQRHYAKIQSANNFKILPNVTYQPNRKPLVGAKAEYRF